MDGYKRLLYKIFQIPTCRKCGKPLDKDFQQRGQGRLCVDCFKKR